MGSNFLVPGAFGLPVDPLTRKILEVDPLAKKLKVLDEDKRIFGPKKQVVPAPPSAATLLKPPKPERRRAVTLLTGTDLLRGE